MTDFSRAIRMFLRRLGGAEDAAVRDARRLLARIEPLVHEAKTAAAAAASQAARLARLQAQKRAQAQEWAGRAAAALARGSDELAAEAVCRELSLNRAAESLDGTIAGLQQRSAALCARAQELAARLEEGRLRLRELSSRRSTIAAHDRIADIEGILLGNGDPGEFDYLQEELDLLEADTMVDEAMASDPLADQLRTVQQDVPEVKQRLEELRRESTVRGRGE